ncbi:MAG: hypothetical protein A4E45_00065 [Methanosaeta sp. PtaB.Bin039]|nr:MAG: hypothetical protein A4E45_00065 [Methanosaeta sp. PtaB.Bin039]
MVTRKTEFGEASGATSARGYDYQLLVGAYYLVVDEVREVEYEVDGEDITIINEEPNRLSVVYIQAKYLDYGSFTLANYAANVFPQFWTAFETAVKEHTDKSIGCILVTNASWDRNLKMFIESCNDLKRGLTLSEIERNMPKTAIKSYQKMRKGKEKDIFQRLLFGLDVNYSWTESMLRDGIINYMQKCQIPEPNKKLGLIKNYILEVGQGLITRRKIEDIIECQLKPISTSSIRAPVEGDVKRSLELLAEKRSRLDLRSEYPDSESVYRDMTMGLRDAGDVIKSGILSKGGTSSITSEYANIVDSDVEKAHENAQSIARLKKELWIQQKEFEQRLTSIERIANEFEYSL